MCVADRFQSGAAASRLEEGEAQVESGHELTPLEVAEWKVLRVDPRRDVPGIDRRVAGWMHAVAGLAQPRLTQCRVRAVHVQCMHRACAQSMCGAQPLQVYPLQRLKVLLGLRCGLSRDIGPVSRDTEWGEETGPRVRREMGRCVRLWCVE
mgnify:CR=1 FL=1